MPANTVEIARIHQAGDTFFSLPPRGGGLGWGAGTRATTSAEIPEAGEPPTLTLPRKRGGDSKAIR